MYEYIIGNITDFTEDRLVLETNHIGYSILVPVTTLANMQGVKDKVKIYIHQHVREDEISLYGFGSKEERRLFRDLIGISGIGPKAAMGILSSFTLDQFIGYLNASDEKAISTAPGIGKKTANRLILELKDKYKHHLSTSDGNTGSSATASTAKEAVEALEALAYSYSEALQMVEFVYIDGMELQDVIKKALAVRASYDQ
ncbi:Holliday junction branch migration protein RuvA [Alkalibacter rhizosphaerae]|uniref:Holliday junction branch migration complex subunit RuvA n=1 Tax=Alkalibacter rhizosphaerae TaxID=2815577 RepID=A0A975AIQ7_9FIRM|nr:Holliday junction branch migration protein RuvA [Alkalibacter rhizosphaerae]QSX08785.1 Holliday junction branch migration protein RuvA [Alkalibacter rhizosphaerae]